MCFLLVLSVVSLIRTFARGFTSIELYGVKLDFQRQDWHFSLRVIIHSSIKQEFVLNAGASFADLNFSILKLSCC